jgi:thiamine biosynthesis lipoprotein
VTPPVIRHHEEVMGTIVTIDVFVAADTGPTPIRQGIEVASELLHTADEVFSTWKPDSPMSRLRRGEMSCDQAPEAMAEVLGRCEEARRLSQGWFDPWSMPGGVDPTGYVKGWAAQRALGALHGPGVRGAIVNAAGDIASFGAQADGAAFRIGIVDPFEPSQLACVVDLADNVATSGTYERGAHLIDPHSGSPMARLASASVCGPDLGLADALATALAVAGEEGLGFVEVIDGYEALTIALDGTRRWTPGFPFSPPPPPPPPPPRG